MMEGATGGPPDFRPWRFRGGGHLDGRRLELFALAAPVFRRDGYRGATIKALAHACGLRPASLYHYFGSKEELATCLLRRPRMDWDSLWVDPETDPLIQLAQLLDLSLTELPNYLLAMRLADEIAGTTSTPGTHAPTFREGEAVFARLVAASAPGMSRETATRVARDALSAMVGSAVLGLDPEPDPAVRERVVTVLRAALVPEHDGRSVTAKLWDPLAISWCRMAGPNRQTLRVLGGLLAIAASLPASAWGSRHRRGERA